MAQDRLLLLDYNQCSDLNPENRHLEDSVYSNPTAIAWFEEVVLGRTLEEIKALNNKEQEDLFQFLYARSNVTENFEHAEHQYKTYPKEPICLLFNRFMEKYYYAKRAKEIREESLPANIDTIPFYISIDFQSFYNCKYLEIIEESPDSATYKLTEGQFLGSKETIEIGIKNWRILKAEFLKFDLEKIDLLDEQYFIKKITPGGYSHTIWIKHKDAIFDFSYPDLDKNIPKEHQIEPQKVMNQFLETIRESLGIHLHF